jgi:hypothetical protein
LNLICDLKKVRAIEDASGMCKSEKGERVIVEIKLGADNFALPVEQMNEQSIRTATVRNQLIDRLFYDGTPRAFPTQFSNRTEAVNLTGLHTQAPVHFDLFSLKGKTFSKLSVLADTYCAPQRRRLVEQPLARAFPDIFYSLEHKIILPLKCVLWLSY